ncbi:putative cation-transporting ATPase 13A3 [Phytophthora citrophthora]|uniref:Cation-transporting ATPase n=1 Tax=Phytophthora citrophthora TaxID=4793 RepID=A0AAD9FZG8_9STRA|nr:putative cation-transporting ATPase 13A3 [Phytophthora citrophthora]
MKSLREQLLVPIDDLAGQRSQLVYASNEHLRMLPFAFSRLRYAFFCFMCVISGGSLLLISTWCPQFFTRLARISLPLSSISDADVMLIHVHGDGVRAHWVECPVHHPAPKEDDYRTKVPWIWFEFKKQRYTYDYERGEFRRYLATIREDMTKLRSRADSGLDEHIVKTRRELFGSNRISIDKPSVSELLFVKLIHPFYVFQIFSIAVWLFKAYTKYALVILLMSSLSLAYEIYSEVSNNNRLRELVDSHRKIQVLRSSRTIEVHETELVPGDVVLISEGIVCADILLLSGGCTVDEASLTGEAIPVNKQPAVGKGLITETAAQEKHKTSVLHAGSTIIRVFEQGEMCKGVVISTGFSTSKGELFRSIVFPKQISFEFERDSYRYLAILWAVAITAFIKRLVDGFHVGTPFMDTLFDSLDLITVAVPPALPLVLTSGIGFSMHRLHRQDIYCIDSQRVNSCGQLSCFCFDKTGTLTKEDLLFVGVAMTKSYPDTVIPERFRLAMATCHGLSENQGIVQGYALEVAMFNAAHYTMQSSIDSKYSAVVVGTDMNSTMYGITKRFPFDATCQRSSVVVEEISTGKRFVFVKGSSEAISAISTSTPFDLKHKTFSYSADGFYCIGFGVKELYPNVPIDVNDRDQVESDVEFEGLALFKNELKLESKAMLKELYMADIDIRVITGDNALTAVHVCRELEMKLKCNVAVVDVDEHTGDVVFVPVDDVKKTDVVQWTNFDSSNMEFILNKYDLAITGVALGKLQQEYGVDVVRRIIQQTPVFTRVRPQQKAWIVEQLISLGLVVGMCGDGTNDCGALKAAHVGLALSSAEASIVAPFTSKAKAISDVPVLIREGRCALTTSFLGFKYMVLYPIVQLSMASVEAQIGTSAGVRIELTDNQYFWDDLVIVLALALSMLYTGPSSKLSSSVPSSSLFSLEVVASLLGHLSIFAAFFAIAFALLVHESTWFCSIQDAIAFVRGDASISPSCAVFKNFDLENPEYGYEDTVIWLFVHLQYIVAAAALNVKDPFRQPFYSNVSFTITLVVELVVNLWLLLDNSDAVNEAFQLLEIPISFRWKLFGLFIGELAACMSWELVATRMLPKWRQKWSLTDG